MLAKTRPRPRKEPREETFAVMAASVDGGQPLPTVEEARKSIPRDSGSQMPSAEPPPDGAQAHQG